MYSLFSFRSIVKDKIRNIGLKSARFKNIEPRSKLTGSYKQECRDLRQHLWSPWVANIDKKIK